MKVKFKVGERDGKIIHYSVGAIIEVGGKYLLLDRKNYPFGFACVAGHIDEGDTPEKALVREVKEESNLDVVSFKLLYEEFLPWNTCSGKIEGHYFYTYSCKVKGNLKKEDSEAKSMGWYTKEEMKKLKFENTWEHYFKKLKII